MHNVMMIGWNGAKMGREAMAGEMFNSLVNFFTKKLSDGVITTFEPVLLSPHGGDMNGFMLVKGDNDKLDTLRNEDEFMNLVAQCLHCVDGFGVIRGMGGDRVELEMKRWAGYIVK